MTLDLLTLGYLDVPTPHLAHWGPGRAFASSDTQDAGASRDGAGVPGHTAGETGGEGQTDAGCPGPEPSRDRTGVPSSADMPPGCLTQAETCWVTLREDLVTGLATSPRRPGRHPPCPVPSASVQLLLPRTHTLRAIHHVGLNQNSRAQRGTVCELSVSLTTFSPLSAHPPGPATSQPGKPGMGTAVPEAERPSTCRSWPAHRDSRGHRLRPGRPLLLWAWGLACTPAHRSQRRAAGSRPQRKPQTPDQGAGSSHRPSPFAVAPPRKAEDLRWGYRRPEAPPCV